jgi:hypothetical protein
LLCALTDAAVASSNPPRYTPRLVKIPLFLMHVSSSSGSVFQMSGITGRDIPRPLPYVSGEILYGAVAILSPSNTVAGAKS